MRVVWKAKIEPNAVSIDLFEIRVPAKQFAHPLCVMRQGDDICVWFEVESDNPDAVLRLWSVGTAFGRVPDTDYLGSVIDASGFVWHLYF
jgi:hypothetical protein